MSAERRCCVRVLSGAFTGSVVPIYGRLEIGRASTADLQLVTGEVSRSHAVIIVRPSGHVLVDLLSTNGTWVRGSRIEEHPLTLGERFRIGDSELVYEVLDRELAAASEVAGERSHRTRRATDRVDFEVIARTVEERRRFGATPPALIKGPDGQAYLGNLLADIAVYRNLRLKAVRDGAVPDDMKARFDQLDQALRKPASRSNEVGPFIRFDLDVPGVLIWEADPRRLDEVHVREIAADGATVTAPAGTVELDSTCWLSIPALGQDGSRRVLLSSRAVWSRGGEVGLMFAGTRAPDDPDKTKVGARGKTIFLDD
jgi:hypothetical protein